MKKSHPFFFTAFGFTLDEAFNPKFPDTNYPAMKNVLVVDDDKIFNFMNSKLLERSGMAKDVHVAWNGNQALDLFNDYFQGSRSLPDIIFLNLSMPVMDGFQLLEAFRKLPLPGTDDVRIVILSSSAAPCDLEKARQLGAYCYLKKPLREETVLEIMA